MFTSRILRNVGATGNRLMKDAGGNQNRNVFYGIAALSGLTVLVYWAGYKAEGRSRGRIDNPPSAK